MAILQKTSIILVPIFGEYSFLTAAVTGAAHPLQSIVTHTKPVLLMTAFLLQPTNSFLHASVSSQWPPRGKGTATELLASGKQLLYVF